MVFLFIYPKPFQLRSTLSAHTKTLSETTKLSIVYDKIKGQDKIKNILVWGAVFYLIFLLYLVV